MWQWQKDLRTSKGNAWSHTYEHCVFSGERVSVSLTVVSDKQNRLRAYLWEVPMCLN